MSLGIAFKGAEGLVLAADSRVTLFAQITEQKIQLPASFDNATKLLRVNGQQYVGAVTYGIGAIGQQAPRTAHSFIPEFERELAQDLGKDKRLRVEDFATRLGAFYLKQWEQANMPKNLPPGQGMVFLVAGYDEDAAYGRVFEVQIPTSPTPKEWNTGNQFGITWGGQPEFVNRLLNGFDEQLPAIVQEFLKVPSDQLDSLRDQLRMRLSARIPYQFLPLQDCVDLAIFLIRATVNLQAWSIGVRGVGGAIDVATITRTDGFRPIQEKKILGERTTESFLLGVHES